MYVYKSPTCLSDSWSGGNAGICPSDPSGIFSQAARLTVVGVVSEMKSRDLVTGDQRLGNRASVIDLVDHEHGDDRREPHDRVDPVHRPCSSAKAAAAPNSPGWGWVMILTGIADNIRSKRPLAMNRLQKPERGNRSAIRKPSPPAMTTARSHLRLP